MITTTSNKAINCSWCGVNLSNAATVKYLNGNLPICDLCLMKRSTSTDKPVSLQHHDSLTGKSWQKQKWLKK